MSSHLFRLIRFFTAIAMLSFAGASAGQVLQADNAELKQLMAQGVTVIDVRTQSEWKTTGIVEGSHTLAFFDERGKYDVNAWMTELNKIAKPGERVALICASGARSGSVTQFLAEKTDYKTVYTVSRGINDWILQGNEVVPYSAPK